MSIRLLFFDLDGTLIDSRDDLADSVNLALAAMEVPSVATEAVYGFIGEGVFNLLSRSLRASLGSEPDAELVNRAVDVFRTHYDRNCLVKTRLYDGVTETLGKLNGFKKAVITNKPRDFSVKILESFGIADKFDAIAGGDTFPKRKPDPMPLVETARSLGVEITECVMIGDSRIDIGAGKNAGIKTIGCTYGFRGRDELVGAGADFLVDTFAELTSLREVASGTLALQSENESGEELCWDPQRQSKQ